jgi:hypothetical protein
MRLHFAKYHSHLLGLYLYLYCLPSSEEYIFRGFDTELALVRRCGVIMPELRDTLCLAAVKVVAKAAICEPNPAIHRSRGRSSLSVVRCHVAVGRRCRSSLFALRSSLFALRSSVSVFSVALRSVGLDSVSVWIPYRSATTWIHADCVAKVIVINRMVLATLVAVTTRISSRALSCWEEMQRSRLCFLPEMLA